MLTFCREVYDNLLSITHVPRTTCHHLHMLLLTTFMQSCLYAILFLSSTKSGARVCRVIHQCGKFDIDVAITCRYVSGKWRLGNCVKASSRVNENAPSRVTQEFTPNHPPSHSPLRFFGYTSRAFSSLWRPSLQDLRRLASGYLRRLRTHATISNRRRTPQRRGSSTILRLRVSRRAHKA